VSSAAQITDLRIDAGRGVVTVPGVQLSGSAAYPVNALQSLGAAVSSTAAGAAAVIFGDTLRFTATAPFFSSRRGVHHLAFPVAMRGGRIYLPEQFFIEWLPAQHPTRIEYRAGVLKTRSTLAAAPARRAVEQRVVILDPGHGGKDHGRIGPGGLREKTLTLQIANRLAGELRKRGYEVRLTRTRDTLIALGDRPRMANDWKRDRPSIFLSLHMNAAASTRVRGFETFFLSEARTDDERRVAEMENASIEFEDAAPRGSDLEFILNGLRNDFYVRASSDLADVVQQGLAGFHNGPDRGVKRAGFQVLVGALMPAVLVEVAFLSNPLEARELGSAAFQKKVALGIADAVDRFFAEQRYMSTSGRE
jgi:N-acetylmuramoyl-L-alanine amidase